MYATSIEYLISLPEILTCFPNDQVLSVIN